MEGKENLVKVRDQMENEEGMVKTQRNAELLQEEIMIRNKTYKNK